MAFRRRKTRKSQVVNLLETYLKFQAAKKVTKGATKGARKAAKGTAAYKVAKKTPVVRTVPAVLVAAVAAVLATKKLRSGSGQPPTPATV